MTGALYNRIEAIERFAADVAHELKNPLTSLRTAVETLPRAKKADDRDRLHAIIQHDVRRLDRLISDISNASRLDAELARESAERVDVEKLVEAMVSIQKDLAAAAQGRRGAGQAQRPLRRHRHRPRQPAGAGVRQPHRQCGVVLARRRHGAGGHRHHRRGRSPSRVTDEGPGIRGDISRIFQRFYTDRPDGEHFGDHSGLGLSISKPDRRRPQGHDHCRQPRPTARARCSPSPSAAPPTSSSEEMSGRGTTCTPPASCSEDRAAAARPVRRGQIAAGARAARRVGSARPAAKLVVRRPARPRGRPRPAS